MKKLSDAERSELWSRLRKENESFEDLCNERDKIVRMREHHQIVEIALGSQLEKWNNVLGDMFNRLMEKEIAKKIKK